MKNFVTLLFIVLSVSVFANNSFVNDNSEITGIWKYEVPTAPYGYEKGTLAFSEKEGKLIGEVKFADGNKINLKDITYKEGELKCGVFIDYEYVSVKAKIKGNKLTGKVDTSEGEMKISAEKEK